MLAVERLLVNLLNRLSRGRQTRPREGLLLGIGREIDGRSVEVRMSAADRVQHVVVLGKTGAGKTHFLQFLGQQHMTRGEGFALLDFHGDCIQALLELAAAHPDAARRVLLIDPTDSERSPGLNPLERGEAEDGHAFARASELAAILRARWRTDAFGARTEELLRNLLFTLSVNGLTLVEAPAILTDSAFRARCVARLKNPDVASYWRHPVHVVDTGSAHDHPRRLRQTLSDTRSDIAAATAENSG